MPDRFGPRGVFSALIPLQNSNMQPEYERMRPEGISNQMYRFDITDTDRVSEAVLAALPGAHGCFPDMIIGSNSLELRNWSVKRQVEYCEQFAELAKGVPFVTATEATEAALRTMGSKRIALISPLAEENSKSAIDYYDQTTGIEIPYSVCMKFKEAGNVIKLSVDEILKTFYEVDHDDIDTFLHIGGSLGISGMVEELEQKLGRPVITSNSATYWYALRKHGITDPMPGFGQLLMKTEVKA
jgi:maleate isomerase